MDGYMYDMGMVWSGLGGSFGWRLPPEFETSATYCR